MKKSKIFFALMAIFFLFTLTSCLSDEEIQNHTHSYGEWVMTKAPTETVAGVKERQCKYCGLFDRDEVEVLTDDSVWKLVEATDSTCQVAGNKKYTSEAYGDVTITLPLLEHTYKEWHLVEEPTESAVGLAESSCEVCEEAAEVEVPALTDDSVWELTDEVNPSYTAKGHRTYESKYGTVEVEVAKLIAPYDSKTYSSFNINAETDGVDKALRFESAWVNATIVVDENGVGEGTAFPFQGQSVFTMIDPLTGKMEIVQTRNDDVTTYEAYVDMKSGIIVRSRSVGFKDVFVCTPFEVGVKSEAVHASTWNNVVAISYTFETTTYTIFIKDEVVYFNVSFTDMAGDSVSADQCFNAEYVFVKDAEGKLLGAYGFNGEKEVELDGFEGTYDGDEALVLSGFGTLTFGEKTGTYEVLSDNMIGAIVDEKEYYEFTLDKVAKTYEKTQPKVTITFNTKGISSVEAQEVAKNIAFDLPEPQDETNTFKGWFYDDACTRAVETPFIPKEDVTLYALWKAKVVIKLHGTKGDDPTVLYLGEGDVIGEYLPQYGVDEENRELFVGWYLDPAYEIDLPEDAEVEPEDTDINIYAKWDKLPAYYGERKGTLLWDNGDYGNSAKHTIKIDEQGNITSSISGFSGVVEQYDKDTQTLSWKKTKEDTKVYKMYFDEKADILIFDKDNEVDVEGDFYIFSNYLTNYYVKFYTGIKCVNPAGGQYQTYFLHVITLENESGDFDIVRYGNKIYSDATITNVEGETLTAKTLREAKIVIIKDSEGNLVVAFAASKDTFGKSSDAAIKLDEYYGVYTNGDETVVLDGIGNIKYGEKTGTYEKADSSDYGFDVYLEDHTEYYRLTLDGKSFTMNKYMVKITFVTGEGHDEIPDQEYNANIKAELPDGTDEGWVFNGWYFDAAFEEKVPDEFIPTENDTLYAKYSVPAKLTIVYNDETTENKEETYSVGDIVTVEDPVYKKHTFVGWYTTDDFQDGTEWKSGSEIKEDTTIYAKWEDAPAYNNKYVPTEIQSSKGETSTGYLYTRNSAILDFDTKGFAPNPGAYPFSSADGIKIEYLDEQEGKVLVTLLSSSKVYEGYIDKVSGIIVLNSADGQGKEFNNLYFFNPFEERSIVSILLVSYWKNDKNTTFAIEYPFEGTTYSIFVYNNKVYFNVKFVDEENNPIKANEVYSRKTGKVVVKNATDDVIAEFASDGEKLQPLDGNQGTYRLGDDTLVISGVKEATYKGVTGYYYVAKEGSKYTLDLYVDGAYYEVTLDKDEWTFTINKPNVTVTFDTDDKATVSEQSVNKNIPMNELPTPTNDNYVFRGWFKDTEYLQPVEEGFIPTEDITLHAKWLEKVTITIIPGKDLSETHKDYGKGEIPEAELFTIPEPRDHQVFEGWYTNQDCTDKYVVGSALEASITIYGKWIDESIFMGNYIGTEIRTNKPSVPKPTNFWLTAINSFVVDGYGNTTSSSSYIDKGSITEYSPETGKFTFVKGTSKHYGYYNAEEGFIAISDSSDTTDLGLDFYVLFKCDTFASTKANSSSWDYGKVWLVSITIDGNEKYIFVKDGIVYYNVSYTSTDGAIAAGALADANQLTILDANGEKIASYAKDETIGGLKLVEE